MVRVQMLRSKTIDLPGGGSIVYMQGNIYLLQDDEAQAWVDEGAAVLADVPPAEEVTVDG